MSPQPLQRVRRAPVLVMGAVAFVLCAMAVPAAAWAGGDGFCEAEASTAGESATPVQKEWSTPCRRSHGEAGNYNICFEATPYPLTTIPEWLTKWQAEDAVSVVFDRINELHAEKAARTAQRPDPLQLLPKRAWLTEVIDQLERAALPAERGRLCIESSDENCHSLPTHRAGVSPASSTPVIRPGGEPELRPPMQTVAPMQPALVDLRVGPSLEYRRLPEQPPPV